jgi:hypothetical protein
MRQDQIIEWSTDGGDTWHHGKTVDARFANDKGVMSDQRGHVRAQVRDEHGGVDHVATRILPEDDPRAEVNRPPSEGKFYAVRQARTKIIGSQLMSRAEADEEVACWVEAEIGPAVVAPDSPALRRAVKAYDQDALGEVLYPAVPPELTPAQARILAEVTAAGRKVYNGRAAKQLDRLEALGLVDVDWNADLDAAKSRLRWRIAVTPAAPCAHPRRRCLPGCLCCCRPCTDRRALPSR